MISSLSVTRQVTTTEPVLQVEHEYVPCVYLAGPSTLEDCCHRSRQLPRFLPHFLFSPPPVIHAPMKRQTGRNRTRKRRRLELGDFTFSGGGTSNAHHHQHQKEGGTSQNALPGTRDDHVLEGGAGRATSFENLPRYTQTDPGALAPRRAGAAQYTVPEAQDTADTGRVLGLRATPAIEDDCHPPFSDSYPDLVCANVCIYACMFVCTHARIRQDESTCSPDCILASPNLSPRTPKSASM